MPAKALSFTGARVTVCSYRGCWKLKLVPLQEQRALRVTAPALRLPSLGTQSGGPHHTHTVAQPSPLPVSRTFSPLSTGKTAQQRLVSLNSAHPSARPSLGSDTEFHTAVQTGCADLGGSSAQPPAPPPPDHSGVAGSCFWAQEGAENHFCSADWKTQQKSGSSEPCTKPAAGTSKGGGESQELRGSHTGQTRFQRTGPLG